MTQLSLDFDTRRQAPKRQPQPLLAIERLRAVLTRSGIDWRYRATRGSILFRPMFGPHFGWQPMCGFYACQDLVFERVDYREHKPQQGPEREGVLAYLAERRAQIDALWGPPH